MRRYFFHFLLWATIGYWGARTPILASEGGAPCAKRFRIPIVQTTENIYRDIQSELNAYFQLDNLLTLGGVVLTAGIIANTDLDNSLRHFWQKNIRCKTADRLLQIPSRLGDVHYPPFYYASIILGGMFFDSSQPSSPCTLLYTWGYRSIKTLYLAGAQKTLFISVVGNGRPNADQRSTWHLGKGSLHAKDKNRRGVGVSAHAFNGAIPFMTAAMMTEKPLLKYSLYACSALPGLARVNDDHHYFSQVFLGWSLSFLSALAIDYSEQTRACPIHIHALPTREGAHMYAYMIF